MSYIIHRVEKLKSINTARRHNGRKGREYDDGTRDVVHWRTTELTDKAIRDTYKPRKDAVLCLEGIYTASPDAWQELADRGSLSDFFKDCVAWHEKTYGEAVQIDIHFDESTPHMHVLSLPLEGGRLCAKKVVGDRKRMQERQTSIAKEVGEKYGLERGVHNSHARHRPLWAWYEQGQEQEKEQEQNARGV